MEETRRREEAHRGYGGTVQEADSWEGARKSGSIAADMLKGAIGGAVGVWLMDQAGWQMYLTEDPEAFRQEKEAQVHGKYAAHVAAGKMAKAAGVSLSEEEQYRAGKTVHYMLGIVPGALYGALRHRVEGVGAGHGLLYGAGMTILEDEIANPLLGFASGPTEYPWQAHARGLVSHLILGMVTDTVCEVLDDWFE